MLKEGNKYLDPPLNKNARIMAKQVWQAEDGKIFKTQELALGYERKMRITLIKKKLTHTKSVFCFVYFVTIVELLRFFSIILLSG